MVHNVGLGKEVELMTCPPEPGDNFPLHKGIMKRLESLSSCGLFKQHEISLRSALPPPLLAPCCVANKLQNDKIARQRKHFSDANKPFVVVHARSLGLLPSSPHSGTGKLFTFALEKVVRRLLLLLASYIHGKPVSNAFYMLGRSS
jgi:hypothetical protein